MAGLEVREVQQRVIPQLSRLRLAIMIAPLASKVAGSSASRGRWSKDGRQAIAARAIRRYCATAEAMKVLDVR